MAELMEIFCSECLLGGTILIEECPGYARSFQEYARTQMTMITTFCVHPNS